MQGRQQAGGFAATPPAAPAVLDHCLILDEAFQSFGGGKALIDAHGSDFLCAISREGRRQAGSWMGSRCDPFLFNHIDALTDPPHHVNGHAVAQRLVAGTIGALLSRLSAPRDLREVVGEALKALRFNRSEPPDSPA